MWSLYFYVLAVHLITSVTDVDVKLASIMKPYCQQVGLDMELLDKREIRYVFAKNDEFLSDLGMVRRRWSDLKDAPDVNFAVLLPDRALVNELLLFNRAYRQHMENTNAIWHSPEITKTIEETEQLYQIWDCMRDARCEYYYTHIRRQAMKRLVALIGIDRIYKQDFPPHVPLWRFTAIR